MGMSKLGARLYETVQEYAAIGTHHRTGTAEDARTLDWFENRIRALGGKTERQPWSFDRYDAEWSITVDGEDVAALPLFYEGTGEVESTAKKKKKKKKMADEQRDREGRSGPGSRPNLVDHTTLGVVSVRR